MRLWINSVSGGEYDSSFEFTIGVWTTEEGALSQKISLEEDIKIVRSIPHPFPKGSTFSRSSEDFEKLRKWNDIQSKYSDWDETIHIQEIESDIQINM